MKKLIIILYPFKFRQFDWQRFEIDELKKKNEVIVFDFINILYPHFAKAYFVDKKIKSKILNIKDFKSYKTKINELILKYNSKNILVLNFIKNDSLISLRINYFIKKKSIKSIIFFNPGISTYNQRVLNLKKTITQKISIFFERKYETIQKIKGKFINLLVNILNIYPNYIFIAGSECKNNIFNYCKEKCIKIIEGHSWDYSQILNNKERINYPPNYAVYLDAPGPKFLSDSFIYKEKHSETINHFYPSLDNFLSHIEHELKLKVVVAPHPKTKILNRSPLFNFRKVISGRTHDLIKNSKIILTRNSTAVCFAAYYNKPIILFYTDESAQSISYRSSLDLAKSLKVELININKLDQINFKKIFKINRKIYKKYLHNFCTSKKNKFPNFQIINNLMLKI